MLQDEDNIEVNADESSKFLPKILKIDTHNNLNVIE